MLRQRENENEEMKVMIEGMRRQFEGLEDSFDSRVDEEAEIDGGFLEEERQL